MVPDEDANCGVRFQSDSKHEDAISCLEPGLQSHSTIWIFTRSHKKMWVSYRHRFHEVSALRALMHAARSLRENGDDM